MGPWTRNSAIRTLKAHEAELRALGVQRLSLFGSLARGEAGPESDVDLAVMLDPERKIGLFRYVALQEQLEDMLGRKRRYGQRAGHEAALAGADRTGSRACILTTTVSATGCATSSTIADWIAGYIDDRGFAEFLADRMTRDAVERCLERITEAAVRIGPDRMEKIAPGLPLHEVRGLGNVLRHAYEAIDPKLIWDTVQNDLPPLRAACERALAGGGGK